MSEKIVADPDVLVNNYLITNNCLSEAEGNKKADDVITKLLLEDTVNRYDKIIELIDNEKMNASSIINKDHAKRTKQYDENISIYQKDLVYVNEIIKYLKNKKEIQKFNAEIKNQKITAYKDKEIIFLNQFRYADDYLQLLPIIVENGKPVNKYSLILIGSCAFHNFIHLNNHYYNTNLKDTDTLNYISVICSKPTKEELIKTCEKKTDGVNFFKFPIDEYNTIKQEYEHAITNYTLDDFKPLFTPRTVSESDAPLLCKLDRKFLCVYKDYVYVVINVTQLRKEKKLINPVDYIYIDGNIRSYFKRWAHKKTLRIFETGNMLFGSWHSLEISDFRGHDLFTKENFDQALENAKKNIDEFTKGQSDKIHFSYPKIEWLSPQCLD